MRMRNLFAGLGMAVAVSGAVLAAPAAFAQAVTPRPTVSQPVTMQDFGYTQLGFPLIGGNIWVPSTH